MASPQRISPVYHSANSSPMPSPHKADSITSLESFQSLPVDGSPGDMNELDSLFGKVSLNSPSSAGIVDSAAVGSGPTTGRAVGGILGSLKQPSPLKPSPFAAKTKATKSAPHTQIHLFYNPLVLQHFNPRNEKELERPERASVIFDKLQSMPPPLMPPEFNSPLPLFLNIDNGDVPKLDDADILTIHSKSYLNKLKSIPLLGDQEEMEAFAKDLDEEGDIYINSSTYLATSLSSAGVIECCRLVSNFSNASNRAIAVVRPPGHHACANEASGFCFLNHVAMSAKVALRDGLAKRVMIIDWDVHHGDGTQAITYDDERICFVSLHRYGAANTPRYFYPGTGRADEVGVGEAEGCNVNIAWETKKMDDACYMMAWSELVLPVANEFKPDLVLISSGFDAAEGDLIGDCKLSPLGYYKMTKSLLTMLGRDVGVVVSLEGGYNLNVIGGCMEAVAWALSGVNFGGGVLSSAADNDVEGSRSSEIKGQRQLDNSLRAARMDIADKWNYCETNERQRSKRALNKGAVSSLNKTVNALRKLPRYAETGLRKVVEQVESRGPTRGTRGGKMKTNTANDADFYDDQDLQVMMQNGARIVDDRKY